jgi:hypothetical protein
MGFEVVMTPKLERLLGEEIGDLDRTKTVVAPGCRGSDYLQIVSERDAP